MLIINDSGTTNVTVTLYENCANKIDPSFVWQLDRKGSNDQIIFSGDDISTSPWYWNEFSITIATSSVDLYNGIIPLYEGEWLYTVYESTSVDLSLDSVVGVVETGILVCGLTSSIPIQVTTPSVIPVFRPGVSLTYSVVSTSTTTTTTTRNIGVIIYGALSSTASNVYVWYSVDDPYMSQPTKAYMEMIYVESVVTTILVPYGLTLTVIGASATFSQYATNGTMSTTSSGVIPSDPTSFDGPYTTIPLTIHPTEIYINVNPNITN